MADHQLDESPRPFRRERNLSNRNFEKRGSRRRFSTESHSSIDSLSIATSTTTSTSESHQVSNTNATSDTSTSTRSLDISYSVNSDTENGFKQKSLRKMRLTSDVQVEVDENAAVSPQSPDPAFLDVKQRVQRFENMQAGDRIIFKTGKYQTKTQQLRQSVNQNSTVGPLRLLPLFSRQREDEVLAMKTPPMSATRTNPTFHTSIDEERSEDDVDEFSDYEDEADGVTKPSGEEYVIPEEACELKEGTILMPELGYEYSGNHQAISSYVTELSIDDFGKVESVRRTISNDAATSSAKISVFNSGNETPLTPSTNVKLAGKSSFQRNYRSTPRPKTEIIGTTNRHVIGKYNSFHQPKDDEEGEEEIELRDKCDKFVHPILEELIKTEETYVDNLYMGIENYGNIFQRKDLPIGLRGKKYVLLGNIEQIAEFHRDEFLPMLYRNRRDLKRLFDEFQHFIDQNCFYGYVVFTMNKQRSLKLCDVYKNYFKLIQSELDDKLGINSFLVQPIQRMARYPLLLQTFITTLFKNRDIAMKPLIESCCRLEKKMRTLLTTTNESEILNDIVDCHEFNVFFQGKFRRVSEFNVNDHSLKRTYRSKVFIFDKCIIYTEIKGKNLVFHGRYPCEHIGIDAKKKSFSLFYERRKQQECEFMGDPALIEAWLELIREMISAYATEERQKLMERYSRENDHLHRKPPSLSLFRDSNRFSSDSGIGNIWVMPKPETDEGGANNRTTWYAVT